MVFEGTNAFRVNGNIYGAAGGGNTAPYFIRIASTCDRFIVSENLTDAGTISTGAVNNQAGTGVTKIVTNNM